MYCMNKPRRNHQVSSWLLLPLPLNWADLFYDIQDVSVQCLFLCLSNEEAEISQAVKTALSEQDQHEEVIYALTLDIYDQLTNNHCELK